MTGGWDSGRLVDVFVGKWNAVEYTATSSSLYLGRGCLRRCQRAVSFEADEGIDLRFVTTSLPFGRSSVG